MSNRIMLINGRHAEQLRVAVVDGGVLQLYDVEGEEAALKRANVYRGVVANIERSLNAAFVDFGDAKHGFLTRGDVIPQAFHRAPGRSQHPPIDQVLQKGQPVIVQVTRDAEGGKGATLTTNVSLAGRFLVYFPYDAQRGVSRKVEDEALRRKLREKVKDLDIGEDEGFIVRTNAADQTKADLKADLQALRRLWKAVLDESKEGKGAKLLYNDQDLLVHSLRDHLDAKVDEVLIDDERLLARAEKYVQAVMPRSKVALRLHEGPAPLFSRHNVESQITAIYRRTVRLPGGGALVIDHAEALTAIDVNSGKSTAGKNQGDTAYRTNLEAAAEVGRQLRLRDIGGLVVVDFIDMRSRTHKRDVEKALQESMKPDRARHQVGHVSANGLVEINRQRIRSALQLRTRQVCPTCEGTGRVITPELHSLNLVRRIEDRAALGRLARVKVTLHPKTAEHTQNFRRRDLAHLESTYRIAIEIVGDPRAELSSERFEWHDLPHPEWEADRGPQRRVGGDGVDRPATDSSSPAGGEPAAAPPGDAAPPAPAPEQGDEGGGRRSRRKRRRRGRKRNGGVPEAPTPERGEAAAAQAEPEDEVNGNVAPAMEAPPAERGLPRDEGGTPPTSRRRRRRRRRGRGDGAAGQPGSPPASQAIFAEPPVVTRDETPQAEPVPGGFPPGAEEPSPASAPAASDARDVRAPLEEPPGRKAPKRTASKKAAAPKRKAKAAPKKAAAGKGAARKTATKSRSKKSEPTGS